MIQGKKELAAVDSTELNDENDDLKGSESEDTPEDVYQKDATSDIDSDEEQRRYVPNPSNVSSMLIENGPQNILLCANTIISLLYVYYIHICIPCGHPPTF